MPEPATNRSLLAVVSREPTVHFAVLAAALFAVGALARAGAPRDVVHIDRAEVQARITEIESSRGTPLTPEEKHRVEDEYIDEQVLVAEALSMGLDDDARIHDFLAQKMLHVLSADVIQPTDAELEAYYSQNLARYQLPATADLAELIVATDDPLPREWVAQLEAGVAPERVVTALPVRLDELTNVTSPELTGIFGPALAERVFGAEAGGWVGPHRTVRGEHWLYVIRRADARSPPLETVREQVRLDWIVDQEAERLERRVAELRGRYSIAFTGPEAAP